MLPDSGQERGTSASVAERGATSTRLVGAARNARRAATPHRSELADAAGAERDA